MLFTAEDIVNATGAKVIAANDVGDLFAVSSDTRTIGEDMIYLPLRGENYNGFDFIGDAIVKGASGYFTENADDIYLDADFIFLVDDTKAAYLKLAEYYRDKVNPKVIMITGSSGKTTVKEMMSTVAARKFVVHKTKLNHNNEIGLCQTLLSMPENTEVLVAEGGMRALGEIELLGKHTKPDTAIITNVGTAHIGRLGSVENIAKAKCEIVKNLKIDGTFVAPDDPLIKKFNDFKGKTVYVDFAGIKINKTDASGSTFEYGGEKYFLPQEGEHNVQNASLVISAAIELGMTPSEINEGLALCKSIGKRWEFIKINNLNIINDCYNSNPDSVKAAIKTFLTLYDSPKILVLGDMGELGDNAVDYHKQTGDFIKQFNYDCLLTCGELSRNIVADPEKTYHFDDKKQTAEYIREHFKNGAYILLKASRSMKFEEIIEELNKECT